MRSEEARGRLIIVCGLPGSGKTTLARRLESEYGAVRMSADEWMAELDIDLFDSEARGRVEQLQWRVAQRLLQLGGVVVIEWGTWGRKERDTLRAAARSLGAAVELRLLEASVDALWERVRVRGMEQRLGSRPLTREDIESCDATFDRPDADEIALFDEPRH